MSARAGQAARVDADGRSGHQPSTTLRGMNVDAIFGSLGRFCVRFRWLMTLVWIVGAVAAVAYLPSLSSVTQNDNTKFLPASAPVEKATKLAAPFGTSDLIPIPVVAVRTTGPLTPADTGRAREGCRPT